MLPSSTTSESVPKELFKQADKFAIIPLLFESKVSSNEEEPFVKSFRISFSSHIFKLEFFILLPEMNFFQDYKIYGNVIFRVCTNDPFVTS